MLRPVSYPKQLVKSFSYRLLSVKRELDDLARQMQQPSKLLYIFGLWKPNICPQKKPQEQFAFNMFKHGFDCFLNAV